MATHGRPPAAAIRHVPGIVYSPLERRARIQGTGLEVFEILYVYRALDEDLERLQATFDWLAPEQLRAALAFADRNPEFVNSELAQLESVRLEDLWEEYPCTAPEQR